MALVQSLNRNPHGAGSTQSPRRRSYRFAALRSPGPGSRAGATRASTNVFVALALKTRIVRSSMLRSPHITSPPDLIARTYKLYEINIPIKRFRETEPGRSNPRTGRQLRFQRSSKSRSQFYACLYFPARQSLTANLKGTKNVLSPSHAMVWQARKVSFLAGHFYWRRPHHDPTIHPPRTRAQSSQRNGA